MIKFKYLLLLLLFPLAFSSCEKADFGEEDKDDIVDVEGDDSKDDEEDKGSDTGDNGGDKTEEGGSTGCGTEGSGNDDSSTIETGDTITVGRFINNTINGQVFVYGYIVGACTKSISNAEFFPPFTYSQALLLADDSLEADPEKVMTVCLTTKAKARQALNLVDNPENYRKRIIIFGFQETYLKRPGIKKIDSNPPYFY
ncbi:MAG: hypothetical protein IJB46_06685 [Prevotella sp.]|nr:hypothetical protein [Prevotella sp.]